MLNRECRQKVLTRQNKPSNAPVKYFFHPSIVNTFVEIALVIYFW